MFNVAETVSDPQLSGQATSVNITVGYDYENCSIPRALEKQERTS